MAQKGPALAPGSTSWRSVLAVESRLLVEMLPRYDDDEVFRCGELGYQPVRSLSWAAAAVGLWADDVGGGAGKQMSMVV